MGKQQQKYKKEYKVEAAKLAKEIGVRKAARELGGSREHALWVDESSAGRVFGYGSWQSHTQFGHESGRGIGSDAQADENVGA